eukprot:355499_1
MCCCCNKESADSSNIPLRNKDIEVKGLSAMVDHMDETPKPSDKWKATLGILAVLLFFWIAIDFATRVVRTNALVDGMKRDLREQGNDIERNFRFYQSLCEEGVKQKK